MPSIKDMIIGRGLVYLVVLILVLDGIAQVILPPFMVPVLSGPDFPLAMATALGVVTLGCAAVLAIPRYAVLGAILVTGFLGGAIATHFRMGAIGNPPQLICLALGVAMWGGLYFSDTRVRALLPMVKPAG